jgi:hypothetical protein
LQLTRAALTLARLRPRASITRARGAGLFSCQRAGAVNAAPR